MVKFTFSDKKSQYNRKKVIKTFANFLESKGINSSDKILRLIREGNEYYELVERLTLDLNIENKQDIINVLGHQRNSMLSYIQELSTDYSGFLVTTPLIVIDVMSRSELISAVEIKPVNTPEFTVTWIGAKCKIKTLDGRLKQVRIPRVYEYIRQDYVVTNLNFNTVNNLFGISYGGVFIVKDNFRIDREGFRIVSLNISNLTDSVDFDLPCSIKVDGRNQIKKEIETVDSLGNRIYVKVFGNLNLDSGEVIISAICDSLESAPKSYKVNFATAHVRYIPVKDIDTRPSVELDFKNEDVRAEVTSDFKVENIVESLQDMKSLYNVDLMDALVDTISLQLVYNDDREIYNTIRDNINEIKAFNLFRQFNLRDYMASGTVLSSESMYNLIEPISPRIIYIARRIFDYSGHYPTYIICNSKLASLLESFQRFIPYFESYREAKIDLKVSRLYEQEKVKEEYEFKVLTSPIIPEDDNNLYMISRPVIIDVDNKEDLNQYVLLKFVYQPVYVISEITHSVLTTFVRSRNAYRLVKPEACGIIEVSGTELII